MRDSFNRTTDLMKSHAAVGNRPVRSTFVTVFAGVAIGLSGLSMLMWAMGRLSGDSGNERPLVSAAKVAVYLLILVGAIGLLHRQNWARLLFVALLSIGFLGNTLGAILWPSGMSPVVSALGSDSLATPPDKQNQQLVATAHTSLLIFYLAVAGLFAWLAVKLMSRGIREEFNSKDLSDGEHR